MNLQELPRLHDFSGTKVITGGTEVLRGELIIYTPHLRAVNHVHRRHIYDIGYHVRDYSLQQWDPFKHVPLGVLAHGTHICGSG